METLLSVEVEQEATMKQKTEIHEFFNDTKDHYQILLPNRVYNTLKFKQILSFCIHRSRSEATCIGSTN